MAKKTENADALVGMKAICQYLGVSESTALKYHREYDLPIKKVGPNGYWLGSKKNIDEWSAKTAA